MDTVLPENRAGADALARALAALGHRRFAVLAGPRSLLTAQDRTDGFRDGLRAWSVPLDAARVVHGELSRDGGYAAMSEILAAGEPLPDCVFAVSDIMAVGALARLRAAGLDVPGDIALAGLRRHPHPARRLPAAHHGAAAAQAARRDRRPAGARRRRAAAAARRPGARRGRAAGQHPAAAAGAPADDRPTDQVAAAESCALARAIRYFHGNRKALAKDDERTGSANSPGVTL